MHLRMLKAPHYYLSLIVFTTALSVIGCGGKKSIMVTSRDTTKVVVEDTSQRNVGDLDYVEITTDTRINPVLAIRQGAVGNGGFNMQTIVDTSLGCTYAIPSEWMSSRRSYLNLINFFGNSKISVVYSVAIKTFDSTNIWMQIQEALSYGKNQLPRTDWRMDTVSESKANASQSYFGRYSFNGRQYNMGFFRFGNYQFNVIIDHPLNTLTEEETKVINYMLATFTVGQPSPTLKIPTPVGYANLPDKPVEEKPKKTSRKKGGRKKKKTK
jgi:hypothetical protein